MDVVDVGASYISSKKYTDSHTSGSQYPPDNKSIKIVDSKLEVNGYKSATQGQMLTKDILNGVAWVTPPSEETLNQKVAQAGAYATQAGNSATQAETAKTAINQRIQFFDSAEAYQEACEAGTVIDNYTVSYILQDSLVGC